MTARHFALIPAAGSSLRMGEPKLLMLLAGRPIILHTIEAWQRSRIDRIAVVVRPDDLALANIVRGQTNVDVVIPATPPPDMKVSLQAALIYIEENYSPKPEDAFLVAPADMPRLSPAIINRLIGYHTSQSTQAILVPTLGTRRGHPVLFPWPFAAEVHALPPSVGPNTIVDRYQPISLPCEDLAQIDEQCFVDIDTPDDFHQLTTDP